MGQAVNDIVIYKRNGQIRYKLNSYTQLCMIKSAEQKRELLGEDNVVLKVTSAAPMECTIGDYIVVYGSAYTLNKAGNTIKSGEREYEQTYTFEGLQYKMLDAQFRNADAGGKNPTANFSIVADLKLLMQLVVTNLNRVAASLGERWMLGECPVTEYKDFTFSNQNCLNVVQNACKDFDKEFEIQQVQSKVYKLHLRKQGGLFPATFDFSKQSGVYKLSRKSVSTTDIITRLYVEGGSQNIGRKYRNGSERLRIAENEESYVEDAKAVAAFGIKEGSKQYDDIYPHRTGKVTAVVEANKLQFVDSGMFDLNKKDSEGNTEYLIKGTAAKVKFVGDSSMAGYTFDIEKYDHGKHTFTLIPYEDKRGLKIPDGGAYVIKKDDEYVLLDIVMPTDPYVTDAERKLAAAGKKELEKLAQPLVEYELQIASMALEKNYGSDGTIMNVFNLGDYIPIRDADLNVNKAIRIKGFTRDCCADPYKYKLILSDLVDVSIVERLIEDNIRQNEIIRINDLANLAKARANWRTTQELLNMVFDNDGYFDSTNIKPNSIETMMLSVGNRAGQFVIRNLLIAANNVTNGRPDPNVVSVKAMGTASLIHYAIEEKDRTWTMTGSTLVTLTKNAAFYVYASCDKATSNFSVVISQDKLAVDSGTRYVFLIGVISSIFDGFREVTLTYGATRITGRTINCGRIESVDKKTYFDLDAGEIGGRIKFVSTNGNMRDVGELEGELGSANSAIDGIKSEVGSQGEAIGGLQNSITQHGATIEELKSVDGVLGAAINKQGTSIQEMNAYINGQSQTIKELSGVVDELKAQSDNTIEYWYGNGKPTLNTPPTTDWKDDATKQKHIGDSYTDKDTGLEYKFTGENTGGKYTWAWMEVASTGVGAAIQAAQEAMGIANSKSHVYVTTGNNTPPPADYKVGDLWVMLDTLKMRYCITNGDGVGFKAEHWKNAGYTDDTKANEALQQLRNLADDSIITASEKPQLKTKMLQLQADYSVLSAQAKALGIVTTNADHAFASLNRLATNLLANMMVDSPVDRDLYNSAFENFYTERALLVEDCTNAKSKVIITESFNTPPKPPYRKGDIWVASNTFKAKVCITSRASGSYVSADWKDAGYTDDTKANEALGKLNDMANDSIITPAEKVQLSSEMSNITADFVATSAMATTAGCNTTDLETAYNQLKSYVDSILETPASNTSINREEYNGYFSAFYAQRTTLIDNVTKTRIESIEFGQTNYFANSAYFTNFNGWKFQTSSKTLYADSVMGNVMRFGNDGANNFFMSTAFGSQGGNIMLPENKWRAGQVYTLAFWVKANKRLLLHVGVMTPSGLVVVAPYVNFYADTNWKRVTYTFKATDKTDIDTCFYIRDTTKEPFEYLMFTKFVLVEGNKAPEWSGCLAEYEAQLQANKDTLKAMTDNFTDIDGGLILSTFLKLGAILKNGQYQESAGFRAMMENLNEVAIYLGGTYAEALAGKAHTILYHNGHLKCDSADITGKITATDGKFNGSLALKAQQLPQDDKVYLSFEHGFNFAGHSYFRNDDPNQEKFNQYIFLPNDEKYVGVRSVIENTAKASQSYREGNVTYIARKIKVKTADGMPFLTSLDGNYDEKVTEIEVYGKQYVEFHSVIIDGRLRWSVDNMDRMRSCSYTNSMLSTWRGMKLPFCSIHGHYSLTNGYYWWEEYTTINDNHLWCTRNGVGNITFEWEFEVTTDLYFPIITSIGNARGYGSCLSRTTKQFTIATADDASLNDIEFDMVVMFFGSYT